MRYQQGQNKKGIEKGERNRDNEKKPTLFPELYRERNKKNNTSVTPFPFNSLIVTKKKARKNNIQPVNLQFISHRGYYVKFLHPTNQLNHPGNQSRDQNRSKNSSIPRRRRAILILVLSIHSLVVRHVPVAGLREKVDLPNHWWAR